LSVNSSGAVPLDTILKEGVREKPDVSALATLDKNEVCVMLWHYHDEDIPGPQADVKLTLSGLPVRSGTLQLRHYRIDQEYSNAYTLWKKMGSPQQPTAQQYAQLEKAGHLIEINMGQSCRIKNNRVTLELNMPRQAVSLLVFELSSENN
jgi:xylan 1,4-beta-xylosidase